MIKEIIILIILFYKLIFIRTRLLDSLKERFRYTFKTNISILISIYVDLLFILIIIKIFKKEINYSSLFKLFKILIKLKINIIINKIKLILNKYYINIFNRS